MMKLIESLKRTLRQPMPLEREPLDHPDIARMSRAELDDLPLPRC